MQFIYDENSSQESLFVESETYRYLFKSRRLKKGDIVFFRNLKDDYLYGYVIEDISRRDALLKLQNSQKLPKTPKKRVHVGWCVVDTKTIEKTIPFLNEIGVAKITFIYCERSQRHFKIDVSRLKRILINSSQQCGRSSLMEIEIASCLKDFVNEHQDLVIVDFSEKEFDFSKKEIKSFLVGCEGGFTENERKCFKNREIIGFETPFILKSETAIVSAASKILI